MTKPEVNILGPNCFHNHKSNSQNYTAKPCLEKNKNKTTTEKDASCKTVFTNPNIYEMYATVLMQTHTVKDV